MLSHKRQLTLRTARQKDNSEKETHLNFFMEQKSPKISNLSRLKIDTKYRNCDCCDAPKPIHENKIEHQGEEYQVRKE